MMMTLVFTISVISQSETSPLDQWVKKTLSENTPLRLAWEHCDASHWRDAPMRTKLLAVAVPQDQLGTFKLAVGRELARRHLADEAADLLNPLAANSCVDQAALHFYRGGVRQTLGQYDDAMTDFAALEKVPQAPKRYLKTAGLLRERLTKLEPAHLSGIAHDMREIRRRLDVGKPDQRTVHLQNDVLKRLDKLIKETENQCKECQASGGGRPQKPAEQSKPLPANGKGEIVDGRKFKDFSKWGDLPPKDREKVLQNLGKDLPANYRDAVEAYFRKLADETGGDSP